MNCTLSVRAGRAGLIQPIPGVGAPGAVTAWVLPPWRPGPDQGNDVGLKGPSLRPVDAVGQWMVASGENLAHGGRESLVHTESKIEPLSAKPHPARRRRDWWREIRSVRRQGIQPVTHQPSSRAGCGGLTHQDRIVSPKIGYIHAVRPATRGRVVRSQYQTCACECVLSGL